MLSSSSPYVVFGIIFIVGAAIFIAGSLLLRAAKNEPPELNNWTSAIVDDDRRLDVAERLELIERLAMVGQSWCINTLEAAMVQERDGRVREAAERALLVIRARTTASYENT